jgi:hypothetical protein
MERLSLRVAATIISLALAGCGNTLSNKGSSADPPTDVGVAPGDGMITVTWTMAPDVQYWLFYAPTTYITKDNWTTVGGQAIRGVTSPTVITGLSNGTTYSVMIDGRVDNGPGGEATASISAVPRLAGTAWTVGTPIDAGLYNLNGVTRGGVFVTVGDNGTMLSSPEGVSWTPLANPAPLVKLSAAAYGGNYVAVGAGGTILFSSDAVNWTQETSNTAVDLTAVASDGANNYLAVGKGGTTVFSAAGQAWNAPIIAGGGVDLYGVIHGNGLWVAVGSGGAVLTSPDAINWTIVTSYTSANLQGIAYGVNSTNGTNLFIAVGAAGTLVTSPDAVTWTAPPPITGINLNAVTYGRQFVIVGDGGGIFTSTDGAIWQFQTSGTNSNLNAVAHTATGYSAVGAGGANLTSN